MVFEGRRKVAPVCCQAVNSEMFGKRSGPWPQRFREKWARWKRLADSDSCCAPPHRGIHCKTYGGPMEYRGHPLRSKPSVERALVEGDHPHQPHIAEKLSLRRPGGGSKRL